MYFVVFLFSLSSTFLDCSSLKSKEEENHRKSTTFFFPSKKAIQPRGYVCYFLTLVAVKLMTTGAVGISESGTVFCGAHFAHLQRTVPPTSVCYLRHDVSTENWMECEPNIISFSPPRQAKAESRAARPGVCAVSYKAEAGPFFAVGIMRCDTWAIQWVVERAGCLAGAEISRLIALDSSLVCGTYSSKNNETGFFVASRTDVARVSKAENRAWRSFAAVPKKLSTSIAAKDVVLMKALTASTVLVVLKDGTMQTMTIDVEGREEDSWVAAEGLIDKKGSFQEFVSKSSTAVVTVSSSTDSEEGKCLLVYSVGNSVLDVVQLGISDGPNSTTQTRVTLPQNARIRHASFAGPFHIAAVLEDNSLVFVSLIPEASGAFSTSSSNPFLVPAPVVATWFDSSSESHMVLCRDTNTEVNGKTLDGLFFWTCPFTNGPYTLTDLKASEMNYVSSYSHLRGASAISAEEEMKHFLSSAFRSDKVDNSAPLKLHYVLAATDDTGKDVDSAVFSVETAPYVHTRLTQQWHNASTGLRMLLANDTQSSCLRLPWNPRHLRRALRLMSSELLTSTFRRVATLLREQGQPDSNALFSECATATVSVALHIITLSRQVGCAIEASDAESVSTLLRAARASGHSTVKYANRMEMLLETCLQQRLINRLLQGKTEDEQSTPTPDFFGVATELRSERQLQTRYNASTWADELASAEPTHAKIATAAAKYLAVAGSSDLSVSDWKTLGARRGTDALLDEFESTLVTFTN